MYIGQLHRSDPFEASGQSIRPNTFVEADGSENAFELLFEELLSLSAAQDATAGSCEGAFDLNIENPMAAAYASNSLPVSDDDRQTKKLVRSGNEAPIEISLENLVFGNQIRHGSTGIGEITNLSGLSIQAESSVMQELASSEMRYFAPMDEEARLDVTAHATIPGPAGNDYRAPVMGNSVSGVNVLGHADKAPNAVEVVNKNRLVTWIDQHALSRSRHHCAMYCRLGMEAAGIRTEDRPVTGDAGDYGPFLLRHGATVVPQESYIPSVGDTAVFDKTELHPSGHIEIFDGHKWVSDFMQHGFSPYRNASSTPPFTIYRLA
jgi:hypothetical protein